jgi:hypothetical protein
MLQICSNLVRSESITIPEVDRKQGGSVRKKNSNEINRSRQSFGD